MEENLGQSGYTMLSTQAQKLFQMAQRFPLFTGALCTVLHFVIEVFNWWKI